VVGGAVLQAMAMVKAAAAKKYLTEAPLKEYILIVFYTLLISIESFATSVPSFSFFWYQGYAIPWLISGYAYLSPGNSLHDKYNGIKA
jgi:hypothetical protein